MTPAEIKSKCEEMYVQIGEVKEQLVELRKVCAHEETFIGWYEWSVGHKARGKICEFCNKFIEEV